MAKKPNIYINYRIEIKLVLGLELKNSELGVPYCFMNDTKHNIIIKNESGYIALISVLLISVVVVLIGVTLTLLSISEGQMSLSGQKKEASIDFVESCVEEVLLIINDDISYNGGSVSLPRGNCTTVVINPDPNWTFQVTGTLDGHISMFEIDVDRNPPDMTVQSWKEIN